MKPKLSERLVITCIHISCISFTAMYAALYRRVKCPTETPSAECHRPSSFYTLWICVPLLLAQHSSRSPTTASAAVLPFANTSCAVTEETRERARSASQFREQGPVHSAQPCHTSSRIRTPHGLYGALPHRHGFALPFNLSILCFLQFAARSRAKGGSRLQVL